MRDGFDVIVHEPVVVGWRDYFEHGDPKLITEGDVTGRKECWGGRLLDTGKWWRERETGREVSFPETEVASGAGIAAAKGV